MHIVFVAIYLQRVIGAPKGFAMHAEAANNGESVIRYTRFIRYEDVILWWNCHAE